MKISKETYYQALGLFITATQHQRKVDALEKEIEEDILMIDNHSHVADAIYDPSNSGTQKEFDEALKAAGIETDDK